MEDASESVVLRWWHQLDLSSGRPTPSRPPWLPFSASGWAVFQVCRTPKAGHLAAVALTIIVLVNLEPTPGRAALARFLEVGLGILVALAVTLKVCPPKAKKQRH
jgi:uncharacterized membrane protein YccC